MTEIICEWDAKAKLGEGPLWVERENAVYWVDIMSKQLHRFSLANQAQKTWTFNTELSSLAARQRGGFICTIRGGFAFLDLDTGDIDPIVLPEADLPKNRFNDGKLDPQGRYWAGSMDDAGEVDSGALYRLDRDLSLRKMDDKYLITNGPAFSIDNKTLYHTDSSRCIVYAFDFNDQGEISNKRVFVQLEDEAEGVPDGMTVDTESCIWLCHFAGARITRYSPEGRVLQVVPMPVPHITSCTFGGSKLDTLYITTARFPLSEQEQLNYPMAGGLLSYKPGVTGLPTPLFAG